VQLGKLKGLGITCGFLLSAALIAPLAVRADDDHHEQRYYDRQGRDYHVWNNNEDHAYRVYLQEQHRDYREFRVVKRGQQAEYFRWRHVHPDSAIVNVEVR
jgi:hypothetical protein